MIEFHDVSVCYEPNKRHPVRSLDSLSFKIERGDWVFLVGPSGAGKSSLLKLIYAGTDVQSGRVVVDGQDITQITRTDIPLLRRKIGIVFQDFQLLTEKTAWENVAFTLRVIGAPQSVIVREVPRALETVGLTHRADAFPHELSGGEQQRIAVARAIVNDPKILLADEPTGNLDPQTAREVGELLTKINFERGTTIVMATHDRSFVNELQRRVVRLKAGKVVSDENPGIYGAADEGAEETAPFEIKKPHFAPPRLEKPRPEPTQIATPPVEKPPVTTAPVTLAPVEAAAVAIPQHEMPRFEPSIPLPQPVVLPATPVEESVAVTAHDIVEDVAWAEKAENFSQTPSEIAPTNAPLPEAPRELPKQPVPAMPIFAETPRKPAVNSPLAPPITQEPAPDVPRPASTVAPEPKAPVVPVASTPPAPRTPVPNAFSENMPIDDFPAPRPMARRIAPATTPAPPPSGHALDPNAQDTDPNAPVGSPENPIVQYE